MRTAPVFLCCCREADLWRWWSLNGRVREHRHCLCQTDDEGVALRDVCFLTRFCEIGEREQQRCHEQHGAYYCKSAAEYFFNIVFEEHAYDAHRNHRDDDVDEIAGLVVHAALCQAFEYPADFFPENHECAEHGGNVYDDSESEVFFSLDAKQGAADCEVSAAADREVFSESLHESEQECLYPIHLIYFSFYIILQKHNYKADERDARAYGCAHCAEDVGVERFFGSGAAAISKNPMTINATDTPMRMKFSFPSGRVSVFFSFFISSIFISVVFLSFEQVVVVEVDVFVGGKERRNAANHHSGKRQPDKYGGNFQLVEHSAHKSADDVLRREV